MELFLNPLKLCRQHHHLKALCKQQAKELSAKGEQIAELVAENQRLRRSNQVLTETAKIAEDKIKAYEILAEKMNEKKIGEQNAHSGCPLCITQ